MPVTPLSSTPHAAGTVGVSAKQRQTPALGINNLDLWAVQLLWDKQMSFSLPVPSTGTPCSDRDKDVLLHHLESTDYRVALSN